MVCDRATERLCRKHRESPRPRVEGGSLGRGPQVLCHSSCGEVWALSPVFELGQTCDRLELQVTEEMMLHDLPSSQGPLRHRVPMGPVGKHACWVGRLEQCSSGRQQPHWEGSMPRRVRACTCRADSPSGAFQSASSRSRPAGEETSKWFQLKSGHPSGPSRLPRGSPRHGAENHP